jgi:tetratricopeptide (TPR) repeat protein
MNFRWAFIFLCFLFSACTDNFRAQFDMPRNVIEDPNLVSEAQLAHYSEAIINFPSNAKNYFGRAGIYLNQKKYESASLDINKAIRLEPNNANFWYVKAKIQQAQNDKLALQSAKRSEELGLVNSDILNLLSDLNFQYGTTEEARRYAVKSQELYPYSSDLQISKGNISLKLGDTSTALAHFKNALVYGSP